MDENSIKKISTIEELLKDFTKTGNYMIPTFGVVLTVSFSISKVMWGDPRGQYTIVVFSIYTMLSAFVSYWHRITWLRHQTEERIRGAAKGKRTDLSTPCVVFFLSLHFVLIGILVAFIYFYPFFTNHPLKCFFPLLKWENIRYQRFHIKFIFFKQNKRFSP